MIKGNRIEKVVKVIESNGSSLKYPQWGCAVDLKDDDEIEYEWNTTTTPCSKIKNGERWKVKMTIDEECNSFGHKYFEVKRVIFLEKLS